MTFMGSNQLVALVLSVMMEVTKCGIHVVLHFQVFQRPTNQTTTTITNHTTVNVTTNHIKTTSTNTLSTIINVTMGTIIIPDTQTMETTATIHTMDFQATEIGTSTIVRLNKSQECFLPCQLIKTVYLIVSVMYALKWLRSLRLVNTK